MSEKTTKPQVKTELEKAEKQFNDFSQQVENLTLDRMNEAPKEEAEPQTKLSQKEIEKSKDIYLKPKKSISSPEKFNEKFRADYNYQKEYVYFIAEHKEIIGETLEIWTKPFAGMPAEFWNVPTNRPVWGPRYLAERIKGCTYHRLTMQDKPVGSDHAGAYYGTLVADSTIHRLDAFPATKAKSVFMGASNF
jgi:hypothetical protein